MGQKNALGIQLQPRDYTFLRGLYESRVMTLAHAAALYFPSKEMAKKRLQKLKSAGIVRERPRRMSEPSVLSLNAQAFELLRQEGHLVDYPTATAVDFAKRSAVSDLTLRHELEVMDAKVAFTQAVRATKHLSIDEFSTWPVLCEFQACRPDGLRLTVRPDGLIRIREKESDGSLSEHAFFLEVDRSTESTERLCQHAHCYLDYYRSGGFAMRHGRRVEEYKDFPFRLLLVCKTKTRRDGLAMRLLENTPPILTQVCLTTLGEVKSDPLGAVWVRPGGYEDSVTNGVTDFATPPGRRLLHRLLD